MKRLLVLLLLLAVPVFAQTTHPPTILSASLPTCNVSRDGTFVSLVDASTTLDCNTTGGGSVTATCKCEQQSAGVFAWVGVSTGAHTVDTDTDDQVGAEVALTDTGAFFATDNVEEALQQVGPTMANARTPTAHASTHEPAGSDPLTVAIGGDGSGTAAALVVTDDSHNHSDGTVADTITASNYLPLIGGTLTGGLSIDNAQSFKLFESDANGSHSFTLAVDPSLTGDTTCTIGADGRIPDSCVGDGTDGGGTPGGADPQVQFNDAGAFGGDAGLTYNKTTDKLMAGLLAVGGTTSAYGGLRSTGTAGRLQAINGDGTALASTFYSGGFGAGGGLSDATPPIHIGADIGSASGIGLASGYVLRWGPSATVAYNNGDAGLARAAAGRVRITNGGAGGGAVQIGDPGTRPTCDATTRGTVWTDAGGAGVADTVAVCAKDAGDLYDWRAIY